MNLTYDQIYDIYFRNPFVSRAVDRAVETKYNVRVDYLCYCINCGEKLPRTSWLCPYNDHKCIIEIFNKNHEILVESITHET
jgi:hypothetical protein